MDQDSRLGWSVEFLDDSGNLLDNAGQDTGSGLRRRWASTRRPSWVSLAVSGVMAAGAVVAIVSVFLTQLTFRPGVVESARATYAMNGLGHYHLVGDASPRFSLAGHAPALGVVAIVGGGLLLVAAAVSLFARGCALLTALTIAIASLASGVVVAALACEAVLGAGFPKYSWGAGFWLFITGASLAGIATLAGVIAAGLDTRSDQALATVS